MLVDFRGCGGSQGDRTTIGWNEAKDVSATLLWVKATLGESAPVLFGHSMGAVAILRAVAVEGVHPRAVIADAPFGRLLRAFQPGDYRICWLSGVVCKMASTGSHTIQWITPVRSRTPPCSCEGRTIPRLPCKKPRLCSEPWPASYRNAIR
jgi:pimeloyl-ACP methyl ester carboxylesterase